MTTETIKELMTKYDEARAKWIETYGTEAGFAEWFTAQVLGEQK